MNNRRYFLFATLFALPFALRKVFWVENQLLPVEYQDVSLYLFEVFLLGYILLSILEHKLYLKSILKKMFHVEHIMIVVLLSSSTLFSAWYIDAYFQLVLLLKWYLYILFGVFFYRDLQENVPRGTNNPRVKAVNCSTWNNLSRILLLSLSLQSLIIIFQAIFQKSLGVFYLGESVIHPAIAGVATIILNGEEFLRSYGTFPHPNLAAFFLLTYILSYIFTQIVPRGTFSLSPKVKNCSTWNILSLTKGQKLFHVEHFLSFALLFYQPFSLLFQNP